MLGYPAKVRVGAVALLVLGMTLLALAACQLIAGTESRTSNPEHGGCALPSGKGPQVRIANFVPDTSIVDVCIRPAGGSYGEPIILNGGTGCTSKQFFGSGSAAGFAYSQVSIAFTAPAQTIDVKMVTAGESCSGTAITETHGLKLSTKAVTTLLRIGGNGVAQKIEALPENDSANATGVNLRFVHVMPGVGPLDVGLAPTTAQSLPTTVETPFLTAPLSFGQVPPAGEQTGLGVPITDNGYLPILQGTFPVVAGVHGTSPEAAVLFYTVTPQNGAQYSLYMAGVPRDNSYPQRGFACNEASTAASGTNPLLVACSPTGLSGISVDVFNTSLYGPNSPDFPDRDTAIKSASLPVLQSPSDIMCLIELDFRSDITSIIKNAGPIDGGMPGRFPYSYWAKTSVTTPATYPNEQNGSPPPQPTIPCSMVPMDKVNAVFDCMINNCNTNPGDPTGTLPGSTDCLSAKCAADFLPFKFMASTPGYNACFDCIIDYAASDQPYNVGQQACTSIAEAPFGFDGQVSQLILSRYPLLDSDVLILPSTQYRQAVLYSRVQLEDQQVDFYCGFFTSTLIAQDLPYVGPYGNDGDPNSPNTGGAYANEQLLQAQDLIQWVQKKSNGGDGRPARPAIIVGDWRSSVGVPDAGPPGPGIFAPPIDLVPETVKTLANGQGWTLVSAQNWTPQCTYCPQSENPLNLGQSVGYFMAQPFLYNWGSPTQAAAAVQEQRLLYTDPSAVTPGPTSEFDAATMVPLSQYYGLNVQVIRPQM